MFPNNIKKAAYKKVHLFHQFKKAYLQKGDPKRTICHQNIQATLNHNTGSCYLTQHISVE